MFSDVYIISYLDEVYFKYNVTPVLLICIGRNTARRRITRFYMHANKMKVGIQVVGGPTRTGMMSDQLPFRLQP